MNKCRAGLRTSRRKIIADDDYIIRMASGYDILGNTSREPFNLYSEYAYEYTLSGRQLHRMGVTGDIHPDAKYSLSIGGCQLWLVDSPVMKYITIEKEQYVEIAKIFLRRRGVFT